MLYQIKTSKEFKRIVKDLNTNVKRWKYLGRGSYGSAYDMGNGLVCKITSSIAEFNATKKLQRSKKRLRGLYRVIDTYLIRHNGKRYGLILTPKYKKLSARQQNELFGLQHFLFLSDRFRLKSMEQIKKLIFSQIRQYHYCPSLYRVSMCKCSKNNLQAIFDKQMKIFRKYNIYGILRSLKAANLPATDIHYLNVMRDGKKFILIDVMT